ncbi:MAG: ParB N-terminal domain-containing protein [Methylocella sp.]
MRKPNKTNAVNMASKDDLSSTDKRRFSGSVQVRVDQIVVRGRYRKDFGDLEGLARNITERTLLQPIGITRDNKLVWGERRLRAVRDILKWKMIEAKIVDVESVIDCEYAENVFREDFTISERVSIAAEIAEKIGNRRGRRNDLKDVQQRADSPEVVHAGESTRDAAARLAKFSSTTIYRDAKKVVDKGVDGLLRMMDEGKLPISVCAILASLPVLKQLEAVAAGPEAARSHVAVIRGRVKELEVYDAGEGQRELIPGSYEREREALNDLPVRPYAQQLHEQFDKLEKLMWAIGEGKLGRDFDWIVHRRKNLASELRRMLAGRCMKAAEKLVAVKTSLLA